MEEKSLDLTVLKSFGEKGLHYRLSDNRDDFDTSDIYPILPLTFSIEELKQIDRKAKEQGIKTKEEFTEIIRQHYIQNLHRNFVGLTQTFEKLEEILFKTDAAPRAKTNKSTEDYSFTVNYQKNPEIRFIEARVKSVDEFIKKYELETYRADQKAIKDTNGIRIITNEKSLSNKGQNLCYQLMGEIATSFSPLTKNGKLYIKDFFKEPEVRECNGLRDYYRGIHAYIYEKGLFYEIQIRPKDIHYKSIDPKSPLFHESFKEEKHRNFK
ncbi:hypothetical protein JXM83_07435 [Candidatus Woesearchaeota archaeon]|nr:hypothetical protein [Candidatus Woesearchaeota archaeon]